MKPREGATTTQGSVISISPRSDFPASQPESGNFGPGVLITWILLLIGLAALPVVLFAWPGVGRFVSYWALYSASFAACGTCAITLALARRAIDRSTPSPGWLMTFRGAFVFPFLWLVNYWSIYFLLPIIDSTNLVQWLAFSALTIHFGLWIRRGRRRATD